MTMTLDSEREGFEAWVQTTSGWKACKARNKPMHLRQNADGSYNDFRVNDRWFAWKARAHLTQPAQSVDVRIYGFIKVGFLSVQRWKGIDSMINTDFDYAGDLPDGDYPVYVTTAALQEKGNG